MVTLSVALIAYGRYSFLEEAVRSIALQTRSPDEVFVFTDNKEALRNILNKYKIDGEIYQEPELSLPDTYAKIGEVCTTDYVLPLEDDDIFKPNKLEFIEKYCRGYQIVKHAAEFIDLRSKPIEYGIYQPDKPIIITQDNAWRLHNIFSFYIWPSTFAIKTILLKKYAKFLYQQLLHADFSIFMLALKEGNALYIPEKLTYYRIGSGHSQFFDCKSLQKVVCSWNKYAYDDALLLKYINNKKLQKIILRVYLAHLLNIYLLNNIYNCKYKFNVKYSQLMYLGFKYVLENNQLFFNYINMNLKHQKSSLYASAPFLAMLSPILGRRRSGELFKSKICK